MMRLQRRMSEAQVFTVDLAYASGIKLKAAHKLGEGLILATLKLIRKIIFERDAKEA